MNAPVDDQVRVERLLDAQAKAAVLFETIEQTGVIAPGVLESAASGAIRDLAADQLGVTRHWHKRVVRAGPNTLQSYHFNPPDREIAEDDIVFVDLGPIFEDWEADFGRTYVLGNDPLKHRLRDDLPILFDAGRAVFEADPTITGEQLYDAVLSLSAERGWSWGGTIAGHLVGQFPHDAAEGDADFSRITTGNDRVMRTVDAAGNPCHWILEIHIVDLDAQVGGFYEELLDVGSRASQQPG